MIIVPALIYLAGFRQHSATGTILAVLLPPIGIGAMWEYYRHGNVELRVAMIMAVAVFAARWSPTAWRDPTCGWPSVCSWSSSACR